MPQPSLCSAHSLLCLASDPSDSCPPPGPPPPTPSRPLFSWDPRISLQRTRTIAGSAEGGAKPPRGPRSPAQRPFVRWSRALLPGPAAPAHCLPLARLQHFFSSRLSYCSAWVAVRKDLEAGWALESEGMALTSLGVFGHTPPERTPGRHLC